MPKSRALRPDDDPVAARLAEALTTLCHETAQEFGLSVSCVLRGLTISLGRIAGRAARDGGLEIDEAIRIVLQQVWRATILEYFRPRAQLQ